MYHFTEGDTKAREWEKWFRCPISPPATPSTARGLYPHLYPHHTTDPLWGDELDPPLYPRPERARHTGAFNLAYMEEEKNTPVYIPPCTLICTSFFFSHLHWNQDLSSVGTASNSHRMLMSLWSIKPSTGDSLCGETKCKKSKEEEKGSQCSLFPRVPRGHFTGPPILPFPWPTTYQLCDLGHNSWPLWTLAWSLVKQG